MKITVKQLKRLIKEQIEQQLELPLDEVNEKDTYDRASFVKLAKKILDGNPASEREQEKIAGKTYVMKKGNKVKIGELLTDEDGACTLFDENGDIITYYPFRSNNY